ncbi:ribonuclease Z [Bacteroidales bacterium OttesenSCG-928-M11]|nr:ribonuclease Z [Bacteroidales bacterium OttesenSCG-928-M11]
MEKFEINILGCGSALPTTKHNLSSQVVSFRDKLHMIDCGEGSQLQFRKLKLNFNRLTNIFISHLHGDHCFGLPGFISTLGLLGRTSDLHIFAQPDAEKVFRPLLDYFCKGLAYSVIFHSFDPFKHQLIYEDRGLQVFTIPLKHRVPTAGFLFVEKPKALHINRESCDFFQVPISQYGNIKAGNDFITSNGEVIPNHRLTNKPQTPRRYAYCSDTAYEEKIVPIIQGVDLLYHEATFLHSDLVRAKETFHSSSIEAASIAKKAEVGQLILGHFSARYPNEKVLLEEAQSVFPNTILSSETKSFVL